MRVRVIVPPDPVVTWEEADRRLRLDGDTDQQADVEAMIAAATAHIDGPDGWLGRAIGLQTLEASGFCFWAGPLRLPYRPIVDMVSVTYTDQGGADQIIDPSGYRLIGDELYPAFGSQWPAARHDADAVRVRYRAGYQGDIPAPIKAAILLMTGDLHKNRSTVSAAGMSAVPMSTTVERLLSPYRVWR